MEAGADRRQRHHWYAADEPARLPAATAVLGDLTAEFHLLLEALAVSLSATAAPILATDAVAILGAGPSAASFFLGGKRAHVQQGAAQPCLSGHDAGEAERGNQLSLEEHRQHEKRAGASSGSSGARGELAAEQPRWTNGCR